MKSLGILDSLLDERDKQSFFESDFDSTGITPNQNLLHLQRKIRRGALFHSLNVLAQLHTVPPELLTKGAFRDQDKNGHTLITLAAKNRLLNNIPKEFITEETLLQQCRINGKGENAVLIAAKSHNLDQIASSLTERIIISTTYEGENLLNEAIVVGEFHSIPKHLITKRVLKYEANLVPPGRARGSQVSSGYQALATYGMLKTIDPELLDEEICIEEALIIIAMGEQTISAFPDRLITAETVGTEYNLTILGRLSFPNKDPLKLHGYHYANALGSKCLAQFLTKKLDEKTLGLFPVEFQEQHRLLQKCFSDQKPEIQEIELF